MPGRIYALKRKVQNLEKLTYLFRVFSIYYCRKCNQRYHLKVYVCVCVSVKENDIYYLYISIRVKTELSLTSGGTCLYS